MCWERLGNLNAGVSMERLSVVRVVAATILMKAAPNLFGLPGSRFQAPNPAHSGCLRPALKPVLITRMAIIALCFLDRTSNRGMIAWLAIRSNTRTIQSSTQTPCCSVAAPCFLRSVPIGPLRISGCAILGQLNASQGT